MSLTTASPGGALIMELHAVTADRLHRPELCPGKATESHASLTCAVARYRLPAGEVGARRAVGDGDQR